MILSRSEISVNFKDTILSGSTSKGNQRKWNKEGIWIKANKFGYEDIAEVVSTAVLKSSNVPDEDFVDYSLCRIRDISSGISWDGCYSNDFKGHGESLITLQRVLEQFDFDFKYLDSKQYSVDYMTKYLVTFIHQSIGIDITGYLSRLATLDALILNEDRHRSNVAFIYNEDGQFRCAPIFDNGLSLLSDVVDYPRHTPLTINTRKVRSAMISTSYHKQLGVLGVGMVVSESILNEFLEINRVNIGRAYDVIKSQMRLYKGTIVVD